MYKPEKGDNKSCKIDKVKKLDDIKEKIREEFSKFRTRNFKLFD